MDEFMLAVMGVQDKCSALFASHRYTLGSLPREMPLAGIYLFSEASQALYVGRTDSLRTRLRSHTANNHNQATFAFLLAREETGKRKATYKKSGSRVDLLRNPAFRQAFDRARQRIRKMDIQFIDESDPAKQALLEICAALRGHAKHTGFENH